MPLMIPHGARVQPIFRVNLQIKVIAQRITSTVKLLAGSFKKVVGC